MIPSTHIAANNCLILVSWGSNARFGPPRALHACGIQIYKQANTYTNKIHLKRKINTQNVTVTNLIRDFQIQSYLGNYFHGAASVRNQKPLHLDYITTHKSVLLLLPSWTASSTSDCRGSIEPSVTMQHNGVGAFISPCSLNPNPHS